MKYRVLHLLNICFTFGTGMSLQSSQTYLEHILHLIKSTSLLLHSQNSHLLMATIFELPFTFLGFDRNDWSVPEFLISGTWNLHGASF